MNAAFRAVKLFIAIVLAGGLLWCGRTNLDCHRPDYSAAQANTVVINTPGGDASGVVIKRGNSLYVWTAHHVIHGEPRFLVKQFFRVNGRKSGYSSFPAALVWHNEKHDVALLWLDAPLDKFTGVKFSTAAPAKIGQPIFHVGNWLGSDFDNSVSVGVISQIGVTRPDPSWPWDMTDQITATIVSGSSGGGVFNSKGEVIGLVVGGPQRGDLGFGLFIPVRVIASDRAIRWAIW